MVSFFHTIFYPHLRRDGVIFLAFSLLAGYIAGSYIATLTDPSTFSLMLTAASGCVSIVSFLSVLLLPFLFTAFAVYISRPSFLIPIAFLKAFLFNYLGVGILNQFCDSGWLLRSLLMFTDYLSLPVLCWLWIRICSGRNVTTARCLAAVVTVLLGIICLDYRFVSPFLVNLLS